MVTEREVFESPDLTPFQFSLWGWMKSAVHYSKVDKQDKLLVCILDAVACINTSDEQNMIFTQELQSAVRLTVGFLDIYCAL